MRAPIGWFGGKGKMTTKLLPLIPPHRTYVEPYGGAASLLFAKEPSPVEVYNDLHSGLVGLYRVLRDPNKFEKFRHLAELTLCSREDFNLCRETWESEQDEILRAWKFWVVARMSFSGEFGSSFGITITYTCGGMSGETSRLLSAIKLLPEIHTRLQRVQIEHKPAIEIIKQYDTTETFFYLDPPYVAEIRRGHKYKHEIDTADHNELIETILGVQGKIMLSGYDSGIYESLSGWQRKDWQTVCHAAGRTKASGMQGSGSALKMQPRTETVWMNYDPPGYQKKLDVRESGLFAEARV